MPEATAGIQSTIDVSSSPTVGGGMTSSPATWSWIWFILAVVVILGFHIRVFGRPIPPAARFP